MSDDNLPVPAEDSILAGLDFETPNVLDRHEAMHMHFAVVHTLHQLHLTTDDIGLGTHKYAKPEWIADVMKETGGDREKAGIVIDELGDYALQCSDALADFLLKRGLGGTRFFVFLPCHQGVATYLPRNDDGKPEVLPW